MHIWNVPSELNLSGPKSSCDIDKRSWDSSLSFVGRAKCQRQRTASANATAAKVFPQEVLDRMSIGAVTILQASRRRDLCPTTFSSELALQCCGSQNRHGLGGNAQAVQHLESTRRRGWTAARAIVCASNLMAHMIALGATEAWDAGHGALGR